MPDASLHIQQFSEESEQGAHSLDIALNGRDGHSRMIFRIEEKPSDSPFVERIWRTQSERAGTFVSQSKANSEIVLTRYEGKTTLTVREPETKATFLDYQSIGAEYLG